MSEFKYPMWFKNKVTGSVVEFTSLKTGIFVIAGSSAYNVGDTSETLINHTDTEYWEDVTDQYKAKAEIPPLKMCGTQKCEHDIPYDSECEKCQQKEIDKKMFRHFQPKREEDKKPFYIKEKTNKYKRKVPTLEIDVYDILKAFGVTNPAVQHAIKKLLCAGDRGYKDKVQDLKEALASISRAIELENENVEA